MAAGTGGGRAGTWTASAKTCIDVNAAVYTSTASTSPNTKMRRNSGLSYLRCMNQPHTTKNLMIIIGNSVAMSTPVPASSNQSSQT